VCVCVCVNGKKPFDYMQCKPLSWQAAKSPSLGFYKTLQKRDFKPFWSLNLNGVIVYMFVWNARDSGFNSSYKLKKILFKLQPALWFT
jgi:hypothetical protein